MNVEYIGTSTQRTGSNGTLTVNATKDAATQEGDVMVAILTVGESGATEPQISPDTAAGNTGWTLLGTAEDHANGPLNYVKAAAYVKVATASEPSTYPFKTTLATSSRFAAQIVTLRNVDLADFEFNFWIQPNSNADRSTGQITTDRAARVMFSVSDRGNSTFSGAPAGYTQRSLTNGQTPTTGVYVADSDQPAGTYGYTLTSSTSSSTAVGFIFAFYPEADPPPSEAPASRWDPVAEEYVPQDLWRWDTATSAYVAIDTQPVP